MRIRTFGCPFLVILFIVTQAGCKTRNAKKEEQKKEDKAKVQSKQKRKPNHSNQSVVRRIARRKWPQQQMAFSGHYYGQFFNNALKVWNTKTWKLVHTIPLKGPRQLVSLSDGSLLAIGVAPKEYKTVRLLSGGKTLQYRPLITYRNERIYGDPLVPNRVLIVKPSALEVTDLVPLSKPFNKTHAFFDVKFWANGDVSFLKDGTLIVSDSGINLHLYSSEKLIGKVDGPIKNAVLWRMLPGPKKREIWIADNKGINLFSLETKKVLANIKMKYKAYDVASGGPFVSMALVVEEEIGSAAKWVIKVYDSEGKERLSFVPPKDLKRRMFGKGYSSPVNSESTKNLLMNAQGSFLVVGGIHRFTVFEIPSGKQVFSYIEKEKIRYPD